ncbi:Uncharacterized protein OBRU01_10188, partial [Operophtera brumata]
DPSVYNNIKKDVLSFLKRSFDDKNSRFDDESNKYDYQNEKATPNLYQKVMEMKERSKKEYLAKEKAIKENKWTMMDDTKNIGKAEYVLDPLMNTLDRKNFRRMYKSSSGSEDSSSSREIADWKEEFKEQWLLKKFEAVNSSMPPGDVYRIYRGDYLCGRTQYVCCSLQRDVYDLNEGFDVSFADSALETDSDEKRNILKGSHHKNERKKKRDKKRRRNKRLKRKRMIKRKIKGIIAEIRKILSKAYKNGTKARKKKTTQLKKFILELKKRYKKDRLSVKSIHEEEMIKIDTALQKKLDQIRTVNRNFMSNSTFRDIVVNGTTNKAGARMLIEAYPDLESYFTDKTRRSNSRTGETGYEKKDLDYDIEYGMLYY